MNTLRDVGLRGNGFFPTTPGVFLSKNAPQNIKRPSRGKIVSKKLQTSSQPEAERLALSKNAPQNIRWPSRNKIVSKKRRSSFRALSQPGAGRLALSKSAPQNIKWPSRDKIVSKKLQSSLRALSQPGGERLVSKTSSQLSRTSLRAVSQTGPENAFRGAQAEDEPEPEPELHDFPDEATPTMTGYLPISAESKSRLYYVFYEATSSVRRLPETPIVLWLNGGPGCSSLIGCFYELGPWRLNEKMKLSRNEGAWNRRSGLLFIDQPIGVGFSIAESVREIPTDEYRLAAHLFYALQSFFLQNPSFMKRPVFLTGESYAGKYVPALAYFMLSHNSGKFAQFAGMAIGNGLTDPRIQIAQAADTAFYFGLLDEAQTVVVRNKAKDLVALIDQAQWAEATVKNLDLVMYIYRTSGVATLLDIRRTCRYHHREDGMEFLGPFLNSISTRTALKVDKASSPWQSNNPIVKKMLQPDVMKSTKWMVEAVLKAGYPVLLYQGMYDGKDGPACNEAWMRSIDWEHITTFWASERELWRVNRRLAGYWRRWKNLSHVVVTGAGHQVPLDQPMFSQDMIERWMSSSLSPGENIMEFDNKNIMEFDDVHTL